MVWGSGSGLRVRLGFWVAGSEVRAQFPVCNFQFEVFRGEG
jgi:hypothetical protein